MPMEEQRTGGSDGSAQMDRFPPESGSALTASRSRGPSEMHLQGYDGGTTEPDLDRNEHTWH